MKRRNVLREKLKNGEPTIGTHAMSVWPGVVEMVGRSGTMDYVEFVGEYGPYDLHSLENFGRAVDLFDNMSAMMKIEQQPRTYLTVRAIGSGIQNVLFADIRDPDDAREAVRATRADTPKTGGIAGAGSRRDTGYGQDAPEDYVAQLEDAVVAFMIEKVEAVENLEEVLSVGGVDMVQFGPGDYSMSIGLTGQYDHPEVKKAEQFTIETAIKMGIAPRVEIEDYSEAAPYIEMGVKDFCIGTDLAVIHNYCKVQGAGLAKALGI